jgi:flagellar export protein FliJ
MKAFRFTLEAVRTIRQRQENEALEFYARALLSRQHALASLEAIHHRIAEDFARMRQLLAGGCTAAQAAQAQNYHRSLEKMREEAVGALEQAERRVNAASQAMLIARQQREIVDVYREKQQAVHQRAELREEQKTLDEFALRRVSAPGTAQPHAGHD